MTLKTYLAFVRFSNVEDFPNFGDFVFVDENLVIWIEIPIYLSFMKLN